MTQYAPGRFYILLQCQPNDVVEVKRHFPNAGFLFDQIDGHEAMTAPVLSLCKNEEEAIEKGMHLLSSINAVLKISAPGFGRLDFHGLAVRAPDGKVQHRRMFAGGGRYGIQGVAAVAHAGSFGPPKRTREERLLSLIAKSDEMTELAVAMSRAQITWGSMNTVYESAKGLMSTKSSLADRRADWEGLVARGWLTKDESNSFWSSAGYYRHGHPRPAAPVNIMEYWKANALIKRIFWHLVDALEPE